MSLSIAQKKEVVDKEGIGMDKTWKQESRMLFVCLKPGGEPATQLLPPASTSLGNLLTVSADSTTGFLLIFCFEQWTENTID